jgi:hypothetical protein
MKRQPNFQTVQWFLEANASGQLNLDPPFQRRTVWSLGFRRFFIDTVLRDFPSPAIFIEWKITPGEPTIYNVVDGKQRLSALLDFAANNFDLGDLFMNEGYDAPYWKDLSADLKAQMSSYVMPVENITNASATELQQAFDRLNRNVAGLKAQELRHAQYPGVFLDRMENLAEASFWSDKRIITAANVRRMRDVEFVSELFLLTMHGVLDGSAHVLDEHYANYAEGIPDEDEHRAAFDGVQMWLEEVPLDWRETRWRNMSDLYALWGALAALLRTGRLPQPNASAAAQLSAFSNTQYEILQAERESRDLPGEPRDRHYYLNVRQGANKDTARQARVAALIEVLDAS